MATKILSRETASDMANQLVELGGSRTDTETGIVVKAPNGKEAFRAMVGTSGMYLTRWPDGLFDERQAPQNRDA